MADVRAELDGKYVPKPKYTPAAPPPDVPEVPTEVGCAKIQPRGRVQFSRQNNQHLSSEAQRYLDGN
jgi:hypothetical protein